MKSPEPYEEFLHYAHVFAAVVRDIMEEGFLRQATKLDITVPQFCLLRLIGHSGQHFVGEMAHFLGVSQAAASKNVDKLVRLELVTRTTQEADRRSIALGLTSRGRAVIRKYETLKEEKLQQVLAGLTQGEIDGMITGLKKFTQQMLAGEQNSDDICMKCNAYYVENCSLRGPRNDCIYIQNRRRVLAPI
jgi:MarR family transcriptional regulator, organic hydroperoxide resistance regulator